MPKDKQSEQGSDEGVGRPPSPPISDDVEMTNRIESSRPLNIQRFKSHNTASTGSGGSNENIIVGTPPKLDKLESLSEDNDLFKPIEPTTAIDNKAHERLRPNKGFLAGYTLALGIGTQQTAWAITGSSQLSDIYQSFFGWSNDEKQFWNAFINCCAVAGLIVGCLFGGLVIAHGRRRAIIIIQTIAILASILTMFKSVPLICFGRFLVGAVACTANVIMGKSIAETMPEHLQSKYGMLTNIFINAGFMITFILGTFLPTNPEDFATDETWKVISALPAISGFMSVLLWETYFTEEPVAFSITTENES